MAMNVAGAVASGDLSAVRQCISRGCDINQHSGDGMRPLAIAAFWGYTEIVEVLLLAGADINLSNRGTLWTPLHCASFQGHGKVVMKLMEQEPDIYTTDSQGRTAIDFASALDSVWPFFHAAGCKRTPKSDLIRMDIIKKASSSSFPADASGELIRFPSSRPTSAYIMRTQCLNNQLQTDNPSYASITGDVLAGAQENSRPSRAHHTAIWNS